MDSESRDTPKDYMHFYNPETLLNRFDIDSEGAVICHGHAIHFKGKRNSTFET